MQCSLLHSSKKNLAISDWRYSFTIASSSAGLVSVCVSVMGHCYESVRLAVKSWTLRPDRPLLEPWLWRMYGFRQVTQSR